MIDTVLGTYWFQSRIFLDPVFVKFGLLFEIGETRVCEEASDLEFRGRRVKYIVGVWEFDVDSR